MVGINCTCEGFTAQDATQIDLAAGKAKQFAASAQRELAAFGGKAATALKHHFKLDASQARGIGRVYQEKQIDYIQSVFRKMHSEFGPSLRYVLGAGWNPLALPGRCSGNPAFVQPVGPRVVHLNKSFLTYGNPAAEWALFHEQVHFASRNSPAGVNSIVDKAYFAEPKKYLRLTTFDALHNADSFTWFARELLDRSFDWDILTKEY